LAGGPWWSLELYGVVDKRIENLLEEKERRRAARRICQWDDVLSAAYKYARNDD